MINVKTNVGNTVRAYSAERTLCDFIKNKEQMEPELYINFIKSYPKYEKRDIHQLFFIAKKWIF